MWDTLGHPKINFKKLENFSPRKFSTKKIFPPRKFFPSEKNFPPPENFPLLKNFSKNLPKIFQKKFLKNFHKKPTNKERDTPNNPSTGSPYKHFWLAHTCAQIFSFPKGKEKLLIPPLAFSRNIPCRILPALFPSPFPRVPPGVPRASWRG